MRSWTRTEILLWIGIFYMLAIGVARAASPGHSGKGLPFPGEVVKTAEGLQIPLEGGRILRWDKGDNLSVVDASGKSLLQVSLTAEAKRESSAQAMGIEVEETDLGGSMGSKRYLSGKKRPQGRAFDAGSLAEAPTAASAEKTQKTSIDGIPLTILQFPTGASLWRFEWPGGIEEIYFDKKKTLVHSQTTRTVEGLNVRFTQWAESSYSRQYRRGNAGATVTYDDNDGSYQYEFFNAKGESIAGLNCKETCTTP